MLNRVLFKLYVYFVGFRFYMTTIDENDVQYYTATWPLGSGPDMVFNFYRTNIEYNVYRWGKIQTVKKPRYGIAMDFTSTEHPILSSNYHGKLMSFFIPYSLLLTERSISIYLLDRYMDFILKQIQDARPTIEASDRLGK